WRRRHRCYDGLPSRESLRGHFNLVVTRSRCSIRGRPHATAHGWKARRSIRIIPENGTALSSSRSSFDFDWGNTPVAIANLARCAVEAFVSNADQLTKKLCQSRSHRLKRQLLASALLRFGDDRCA